MKQNFEQANESWVQTQVLGRIIFIWIEKKFINKCNIEKKFTELVKKTMYP